MTAASASLATADVLAFIGDPSVWRGELEQFTETLYRELYGQPGDVVDVPDVADDGRGDGACAACIGTGRESGGGVCPACDGTGEAPSIQPTNASASGFHLAGDGSEAGGIEGGAAPWWRPEPAPVAPEGDPDRPVYLPAGADELGPLLHAWGAVYDHDPATGAPAREYLGIGRLLGTIQRERYYSGDVAYFEIGCESREAVQSDDVVLPIVERADLSWDAPVRNAFLPEYPRCPDCGGRIEWAEAGGVPGSRRCAGATEPDMPAAGTAASPGGVTSDREAWCGSRYVDTRFGVAMPVPEGEPGRVWHVQGFYGDTHGWETLTVEDDRSEAEARLNEYRANEPQYRHRIREALDDAHGRAG